MQRRARYTLDKAFTGLGTASVLIMAIVLLVLLVPITWRGCQAFIFRGTYFFRQMQKVEFDRGNTARLDKQRDQFLAAMAPAWGMINEFEAELKEMPRKDRKKYKANFRETKKAFEAVFGPLPDEKTPILPRSQYGQTRWDRANVKFESLYFREMWDYNTPTGQGVQLLLPRDKDFAGTKLEPLFDYVKLNLSKIMQPEVTFYWQFLVDKSIDSHFFGGIGPEVLGTIYLTIGAILFAVPIGITAAVYLCEFARPGSVLSLIRTCVNTLAGVPSIVFGLFGLAFFLNSLHVSQSKSVLAGALTLALMVLPTIIRATEEAIRAVPHSYKEASLGLGASHGWAVLTVILPAALPGIMTGIVLSMGRAAGETAPIIFTAAVSLGAAPKIMQVFSEPTPALSWNIYNLCTEHEAVNEIRHVQYGMVLALIVLVLALNMAAIVIRARISKKLKG
ncbi:MAG: phosphate ABC transporter permease PstA [Spartobacteria bacterium]|nr:phosphate ABC transporter permease PstA [Spartobacteria bacterium]